MKKFILIVISIFLVIGIKAQGNLQFSQVITYSGNMSGSANPQSSYTLNGPSWTVPANKVWKIENSSPITMVINGFQFLPNTDKVIWLKANDVFRFSFSGFCNNSQMAGSCSVGTDYFISIIEFNVVP
jgi:hypothetical protein